MILNIGSDTTYLSAPKSRSRVLCHYHLIGYPSKAKHPRLNRAIDKECKLNHVVSSAIETEVRGVFRNAKFELPIILLIETFIHPQSPTPVKTDNSNAFGFIYNNIH